LRGHVSSVAPDSFRLAAKLAELPALPVAPLRKRSPFSYLSGETWFPPRSLAEANFLAPLAGEEVDAVDEADPVAARAHDERVRARGVGEVADAAQQLAARDAGRGDDHLLRREVVDREDALDVVDPMLVRVVDLVSPRRPELRLKLAAEAAERRRGEHRLARASDPDRQVVVRPADRGGDRSEHVAVLDQLDARAGGADL